MIPRTLNLNLNYQNSNMNRPPSPKFGHNYGLRPPHNDRQSLIDQIINNCKRAESPLNNKTKTTDRGSYAKFEPEFESNKQNFRNLEKNSREKYSLNKRQSYESQAFNSGRSSCENSFKDKKINPNQNSSNNSSHQTEKKLCSQYYQKPFPKFIPHSPTYKFKPHFQIPKPNRPDSFGRQESVRILETVNEEQKIRQKIEQEKIKHIQHCKREQRKLRIYYVQLENKLCEMRNKQLRMLAQFEAQKLKQLDEYEKSIQHEGCTGRFEQLNKNNDMRVNDQIKAEVQGCLISGVSGVFFSFDQRNIDTK